MDRLRPPRPCRPEPLIRNFITWLHEVLHVVILVCDEPLRLALR